MLTSAKVQYVSPTLPEPHPLDIDWRFTKPTTDTLADLAGVDGRHLAVGTPTLAEALERSGREVVLVDRQPIQRVRQHLKIDPGMTDPIEGGFDRVIMDPPWYPKIYVRWLSWAAQSITPGGKIIATMWTDATRPSARKERGGGRLHDLWRCAEAGLAQPLAQTFCFNSPTFKKINDNLI